MSLCASSSFRSSRRTAPAGPEKGFYIYEDVLSLTFFIDCFMFHDKQQMTLSESLALSSLILVF